jgi:hypothetical protein
MVMQFGAQAAAARAHEELFAYWSSRRAGARLPCRADIQPDHFKRHLPTVSLIDVGQGRPRPYRMRLAGTGLYGLYGREITGRTLEEIYAASAADYWRRELDQVVESRRPQVGLHSFAWRGQPHQSVLWIRLPLASNGSEVDMILGYDAPLGLRPSTHQSGIRAA